MYTYTTWIRCAISAILCVCLISHSSSAEEALKTSADPQTQKLYMEVVGGLGNQLFIICAALSYSYTYNSDVVLLDHIMNRNSYWNTLLSGVQPLVADMSDTRSMYWVTERHIVTGEVGTFHFYSPYDGSPKEEHIPVFIEKDLRYVPIPHTAGADLYVLGYFQRLKHFMSHWDRIDDRLGLTRQRATHAVTFNDATGPFANELPALDETVALHFRIGDYVKLKHLYLSLPVEYYANSLTQLIQRTGKDDWNVLWFYGGGNPDDEAVALGMVLFLKSKFTNLRFKKTPDSYLATDSTDFFLLSLCRHIITANSTFSWWAAFLNNTPGRLIFYPFRWTTNRVRSIMGDSRDMEGYTLKDWVPVEFPLIFFYTTHVDLPDGTSQMLTMFEGDHYETAVSDFAEEFNVDQENEALLLAHVESGLSSS